MEKSYSIRELTAEEFLPLFDKHKKSVFEDTHSYDFRDLLSQAEQKHVNDLGQNMGIPYKLYLGAFDGDNQFVGWSWGYQETSSIFYMVNSAVLKITDAKDFMDCCSINVSM